MTSPSIASSDDDPFALERYLQLPKKSVRAPSVISTSSEGDPFGLEKYIKPASIMDRKIETRGLTTSFSSNIGRRLRMPETPTRKNPTTRDNYDSGKKDIYNWLEKTKEPPPLTFFQTPKRDRSRPRVMSTSTGGSIPGFDRDSTKTYETPVSKSYAALSESPLPNNPTAPESYELDLLNYKKFFNNRPLCRCLDEGQPEGDFFQRERPTATTRPTGATSSVDFAFNEQQKVAKEVIVKPTETNRDSGVVGVTYSDSEYSDDQEETRDPEDVRQLWSKVRSRLWIPDDELDADADAYKEEEPGLSVAASPTPITEHPRTPSPSDWVMMAAPTKWSYTSSMERGDIYLGEHYSRYPLVPDLPSRPHSLEGMETNGKMKMVEELFSESKGERTAHYQHVDYNQITEKMATFDEFLATVSPSRESLHRTLSRRRRPTF